MEKLLCFIPCYNCAPQISRVLKQFTPVVSKYFDEILVLDNGSKDDTIKEAIETAETIKTPKIRISQNLENYNLGGSHKAAFAYALENGFTHVVVLHGDDQGNIEDILPVLESGEYKNYDALLGARFMAKSKIIGYSSFRTIGNHVFNALFSIGSGRLVQDLGSGLNIFSANIYRDKDIKLFADDLRFNIFLLLNIIKKKHNFKFFPISWREEDQISNVRLFSQAMKTISILYNYLFNKKNFNNIDFREKPFSAYNFETIYNSENDK